MDLKPVCSRCGSTAVNGLCPMCPASEEFLSPAVSKPARTRWVYIVAVAASLAFNLSGYLLVKCVAGYLQNWRHGRYLASLHHIGPTARVDELKGSGRIYLVQMGAHKAPYAIEDFASWLREKYSLDVRVLPPMGLEHSAWDSDRWQYVAELLFAEVKGGHADLAADPNAYLIGLTDADMYSVHYNWGSSFTQRDMHRVAIISADGMQDNFWERHAATPEMANQHFQARLRRILLKDVGMMYWQLPVNNDPTSLFHQTLDPDLPTEDIYESDLNPDRTRWGMFLGEPCIFFGYSAKNGIKELPGPLIRTCVGAMEDTPTSDESVESFGVDLRLGLLIDRHTDFYLPGTIPIDFQRTTRDGWQAPMGFGISGSHNYDKYLSSADMRAISVVLPDSGTHDLKRKPWWLSELSLVKYIDTDYSGSFFEMHWRVHPSEHFDLRRYDGEVEAYLPSDSPKVLCFLDDYHNAQGEELVFKRDNKRRLMRLTSPNKSWLSLSYDAGDRIAEIDDSRGRVVRYGYDGQGRMVSVTYPSGEILTYTYDDTQHLLSFSAAPDAKSAPKVLLRNEYSHGRLAKLTLADGTTYTYEYTPKEGFPILGTRVHTPDGKVFDLRIGEWDSTVWERVLNPKLLAGPAIRQ